MRTAADSCIAFNGVALASEARFRYAEWPQKAGMGIAPYGGNIQNCGSQRS
jgi:hypothetical protein